jgi:uncharacterized membrane protein
MKLKKAIFRYFWNLGDLKKIFMISGIGFIVYHLLGPGLVWEIRLLLSWLIAGITHLLSVLIIVFNTDGLATRSRSLSAKANHTLLLFVIAVITFLTNIAVGILLNSVKQTHAGRVGLVLSLSVAAVVVSWMILNLAFGLHYSRLYYDEKDNKGLPFAKGVRTGFVFAECENPCYMDFCYLAFTIALNYSVSDVTVNRTEMRMFVLFHGITSFVFYSTVVTIVLNTIVSSWNT